MSTLTYIIGWPLAAALFLCLVPRDYKFVMRLVAVVVTFIVMVLAVKMFWQFNALTEGYQFEQQIRWLNSPGLNFSYHVGVDGLNAGLILMGAVVAFAASLASWKSASGKRSFTSSCS